MTGSDKLRVKPILRAKHQHKRRVVVLDKTRAQANNEEELESIMCSACSILSSIKATLAFLASASISP